MVDSLIVEIRCSRSRVFPLGPIAELQPMEALK